MNSPNLAVRPPDVTILLPQTSNRDRTNARYKGLCTELAALDVDSRLVVGMNTYNESTGTFPNGYVLGGAEERTFVPTGMPVRPKLVRDLTMALGKRPLYESPNTRIVHDPACNQELADKGRVAQLLPELHPPTSVVMSQLDVMKALDTTPGELVVAKPTIGKTSEGVHIGPKAEIAQMLGGMSLGSQPMLVQAFVETERGMPELGIQGRHNARVVLIGGRPIFAFGRLVAKGSDIIKNDSFDSLHFTGPDDFPDDLLGGVEQVRRALASLPDGMNTVVAADFMRGSVAGEDDRLYLCELNRRPLRNSPYDSKTPGNLWASHEWDVHEAELLKGLVDATL